uniref:Serine-threonine/tyrosine-protein kinase catalytic domain-containing protein n=1 Tax=Brassica oleracea var. oleracea TaxID=109376 RepID=A0A0D3B726_BRAOL
MYLIMRLGLEMKEGLLLWWLSRGMTENLSREGSVIKQKTSVSSLVIDPCRVTQLSWTPRVFLYKGFLTDEECDHFINLALSINQSSSSLCFLFAKGKLEKSMVADNDSEDEFCREIELLARLHHRHLVALKGFCVKKNER